MSPQKPFSVVAGDEAEDEHEPPVETFAFVVVVVEACAAVVGVEC